MERTKTERIDMKRAIAIVHAGLIRAVVRDYILSVNQSSRVGMCTVR